MPEGLHVRMGAKPLPGGSAGSLDEPTKELLEGLRLHSFLEDFEPRVKLTAHLDGGCHSAIVNAIVTITSFRPLGCLASGTRCPKGIPPGNGSTAPAAQALALVIVRVVRNDWPQWRELTAANYSGMCKEVVVDRRRILELGR